MEIKTYTNKNAKKIIKKIINTQSGQLLEQSLMFLCYWLSLKKEVICYTICEQDIIKCIILLSKCDFDPFKKYLNPYLIDYIYTLPEHRRLGYANKILEYVKTKKKRQQCVMERNQKNYSKNQDFLILVQIQTIYKFIDFLEKFNQIFTPTLYF